MNDMNSLPASKALDQFYLEARCRLLDLAAILDRVHRGPGAAQVAVDPRVERIRTALEVLRTETGGTAERVQRIFSLDYDQAWEKPKPRG